MPLSHRGFKSRWRGAVAGMTSRDKCASPATGSLPSSCGRLPSDLRCGRATDPPEGDPWRGGGCDGDGSESDGTSPSGACGGIDRGGDAAGADDRAGRVRRS